MIGLNTSLLTGLGRHYLESSQALNRSMERLATGRRINHAADDPAGMIASEALAAEERTIQKHLERLDFEEHRLGAIDGAYSVIDDLTVELSGLVVRAANRAGLSDDELQALQLEADSILQAIDHLGATTVFSGEHVLQNVSSRSLGTVISWEDQGGGHYAQVTRTLANLATGGDLNLIDGDLEKAQQVARSAVDSAATRRGAVGARLKAIEGERAELLTRLENTSAARSLIADTDYAAETAALVRAQVLQSAALFVRQTALQQTADMILALLH